MMPSDHRADSVDGAMLCLANARLVLADAVATGCVRVRDGRIDAIERTDAVPSGAIDCGGDTVLPGLVELHTDNIEKHLRPRSGALWPALPSLLAHDAELVAAGITTALDALSLGDLEDDDVRTGAIDDIVCALDRAQREHLLRADHYLHLRCELGYPGLPSLLAPLAARRGVRLLSLMDHTPGQRQFRDTGQYRRYYARSGRYWDDAGFAELVAARRAQQGLYRDAHLAMVLDLSQRYGIRIASHDDADAEHITEARGYGACIAEFPTTLAAARAARDAGLAVVAGAPNLVRGASHSGNVAALELARADCVDIFSSDYVPGSLLHSAFLLHARANWTLPRAIASVTRRPARALGFSDRGELAVGLRADLVRVRLVGELPIVQSVWAAGQRVH